MEKLVRIALAALFLLGIACAQNVPAIDVFGGYSYLNFDMPASTETNAAHLALNGWEFSGAVHVFRRFAAEGEVSGHNLSDCAGESGMNCSDFSYMGGLRYNFGNHSSKITGFVHGLVGQDRADLPISSSSTTQSDTSLAFAAGGGIDYWFFRHVGFQLGPADYLFTRHLNNFDGINVPIQNNIRVSGGIVFRFGGESAPSEPKARSRRAASVSTSTSTSRPATVAAAAPQPAPLSVSVPGRGMSIPAFGLVVAPQEFDGAKIVEIVPGGVAEMASMKVGDLIKSVDGKPVKTPMELVAELSDKSGKVRIGIQRGDFATETLILLGAH